MAKKPKYPKTLWITKEDEGPGYEFFLAFPSPNEAGSTRKAVSAGVYQFVEEVVITAEMKVRPRKM